MRDELSDFFIFVFFVLTWLEFFNIVNRYNPLIYTIHNFLFRIVDPLLTVIRRIIPMRAMDFSPIILLMALYFLQLMIARILQKFPV